MRVVSSPTLSIFAFIFSLTVNANLLLVPESCGVFLSGARNVLSAIGTTTSKLCGFGDVFSAYAVLLNSCISNYSTLSQWTFAPDLVTALALCDGLSPASQASIYTHSACCALRNDSSLSQLTCGAYDLNATSCSTLFAAKLIITDVPASWRTVAAGKTAITIPSDFAAFPTPTNATSSAWPTSTTTPTDARSNDRQKAKLRIAVGASVGGVIGILLLAGAISFAAHRRNRCRAMQNKEGDEWTSYSRSSSSRRTQHTYEKAQLHGDHIERTNKELPGQEEHTMSARKELPGQDDHRMSTRSELAGGRRNGISAREELPGQGENRVHTVGGLEEMDATESYIIV